MLASRDDVDTQGVGSVRVIAWPWLKSEVRVRVVQGRWLGRGRLLQDGT